MCVEPVVVDAAVALELKLLGGSIATACVKHPGACGKGTRLL
ncbi:hypothetical protein ACFQ7I_13435 [Streptomyces massasporeus]